MFLQQIFYQKQRKNKTKPNDFTFEEKIENYVIKQAAKLADQVMDPDHFFDYTIV